MSEPFLGQIALFPYNFAPRNWANCQGQLLPISQNTALFSLLGTNFGGDGRTTFGLPDLQGRVALGQGTLPGGSTYSIGEMDGVETVTLLSNSLPAHNHSLNGNTAQGATNAPAGGVLATAAKGTLHGRDVGNIYNTGQPNTSLVAASVAPAGSNQPHNNVQPSLVLRYCIALAGIFPSRS